MIRLEMKDGNTISTEKQQKYQHYHLEKLINMNILQMKRQYLLMEDKQYNKRMFFTYCFLWDTHEEYLSLKDVDGEQSKFANKLKNIYQRYKIS